MERSLRCITDADGCLLLMSPTAEVERPLHVSCAAVSQSSWQLDWSRRLKRQPRSINAKEYAYSLLRAFLLLVHLTHPFWLHVASLHLIYKSLVSDHMVEGCCVASHVWWRPVTHCCQTFELPCTQSAFLETTVSTVTAWLLLHSN